MTTSTSAPPEARAESSLSTLTAVGCVLATFGSVVYISMNGMEPREAFAHPLNIASGMVSTIGILLLAVGLLRWRTALPGWAVVASAVGLLAAAANAWGSSTMLVAAAKGTTNEQFEDLFFNSPWLLLELAPKSLLCPVGFLALAICGWRSRAIPRPAAAALGVAAVLSIWPPYPPGLIIASLALFLIARSGMTTRV